MQISSQIFTLEQYESGRLVLKDKSKLDHGDKFDQELFSLNLEDDEDGLSFEDNENETKFDNDEEEIKTNGDEVENDECDMKLDCDNEELK